MKFLLFYFYYVFWSISLILLNYFINLLIFFISQYSAETKCEYMERYCLRFDYWVILRILQILLYKLRKCWKLLQILLQKITNYCDKKCNWYRFNNHQKKKKVIQTFIIFCWNDIDHIHYKLLINPFYNKIN